MKHWNAESIALIMIVGTIPLIFMQIAVLEVLFSDKELMSSNLYDLLNNMTMIIVGGAFGYMKAKTGKEELK